MWMKLGLTILLLSEIMGIVSRIFMENVKKINFEKLKVIDKLNDKENSSLASVIIGASIIVLLGFPLHILSVMVIVYGIISLDMPAMLLGLFYVFAIIFSYKKYPILSIINTIISVGLIIWWATLI